ncbi:hypothetical protein [Flavihumibacter fluvii]|uniref:hypothetical protein n=1 Tax=Flavihumibacter fluvii TaxID=2838157 RepID=UPI001BDE11A0|nr:hypothetical protein [Flavihumibacter fluvii]ULQ54090.1 hypothetical protein KJS93_07125 [Flavihumibacter fluvii]
MLENLINLIKENAGDAIINNPAIPNEQNEAVVQEAGNSIVSGLQALLAQGNAKDVLGLFSNPSGVSNSNPVVQQLGGGFLHSLMDKFGLDSGQAGGIVSSLLPTVLSQLVSRTNNANDGSFDIQGIFNTLSGGNTSGLDVQGLLNKFTGGGPSAGGGLDRDGDGDVDLQDLTAAFSGGGTSGGSPLDAVKGLFGQ